MKSFFFVPGDREDFIQKAKSLDADYLVFDLEDSVSEYRRGVAVNNLLRRDVDMRDYLRVYWPIDKPSPFRELVIHGYSRFMLPKIQEVGDVDLFLSLVDSHRTYRIEIIVLVESPLALHNTTELAQHPAVVGLCFGAHDYFELTGMEPLFHNIAWHRNVVLNTSKAFGKMSLDVASMNVTDASAFRQECESAKSMAFDGKLLIHPWQLGLFNDSKWFSEKDIQFAKKVKAHIQSIGGMEAFSVTTLDGQVVERPHIERINRILKESGYDTI